LEILLSFEANLVIKENQLTDKVNVHALDKSLTLFNLESIPQPEIDPLKIKEQMMEGKLEMPQKDKSISNKELTIDLHLDAQRSGLPENEILGSQLELFEKSFDQALLNNAKSLKVIHGIGSGKLRREIHKRISKRSEVHYFEDGDREKFGFGSTIIYF
jgi:dsDNA-specific endonuclease/ATPase MutS2